MRSAPLHRSQPAVTEEVQDCGRARVAVHHLGRDRTLIKVTGDVDATNRRLLGLFVERHIRTSQQLILDLCDVDFFGSQGFTALHYVGVCCARRDVDWVVAASRAVQRIMRICDTDAELPVANDLSSAARRLDHFTRRREFAADHWRPTAFRG